MKEWSGWYSITRLLIWKPRSKQKNKQNKFSQIGWFSKTHLCMFYDICFLQIFSFVFLHFPLSWNNELRCFLKNSSLSSFLTSNIEFFIQVQIKSLHKSLQKVTGARCQFLVALSSQYWPSLSKSQKRVPVVNKLIKQDQNLA